MIGSTNSTADQNVKDGEMVPQAPEQAPAPATDPFEGHRETINPFSNDEKAKPASTSSPILDRRASTDEWDAAKTTPSKFQQRKGSVFATPKTRGDHVGMNSDRDAAFHELHDKKYGRKKRKSSSSKDSLPQETRKHSAGHLAISQAIPKALGSEDEELISKMEAKKDQDGKIIHR